MPEKFKTRAAVLLPSQNDKLFSARAEEKYELHYLEPELFYNQKELKRGLDLVDFVSKVVGYLNKNKMTVVLALNDLAAVLLGAVAVEAEKLHGIKIEAPSVESSLLCLHKVLTREVLDLNPIWFKAVPLGELEEFGQGNLPFFVKPSTTSSAEGTFPVANSQDLCKAVEYLKQKLPEVGGFLNPFIKKYGKLPAAEIDRVDPSKVVLCEQLMQESTICFVDGTVDGSGRILPWFVGDNNYQDKVKSCFSDCSVPSKMVKENPRLAEELKKQFELIGQRLVSRGYRSLWLGVEFFVEFKNDAKEEFDIRLLEINGRMSVALAEIYQEVYGLDIHEMQVELSLGRSLDQLFEDSSARLANPGLVGSLGFISVFVENDVEAQEVVDFDEVDKIIASKEVELRMKVYRGTRLAKSCSSGTKIAYMSLYCETKNKNMQLLERIQSRILKRPELAPNHPDFAGNNFKIKKTKVLS